MFYAPRFSAAKIEKKSAQITLANTVIGKTRKAMCPQTLQTIKTCQ